MFHFRMQEVNFSIYVFKRILTETVGVKHRCKKEKKKTLLHRFVDLRYLQISSTVM